MSEMVERVARAICLDLEEDPDAPDTPYEIRGWRLYRSTARAAIAAMREPTEAMIRAGETVICDCLVLGEVLDENPAVPTWEAMIEAALKEA